VSAASTSSFPAMYNVATGTAGICNFIQAGGAGEGYEGT